MIASERSFNRSMFYCKRNKNIQFPITFELNPLINDGKEFTYETDDYWDSEKSMFLDIITDMILHKFYFLRTLKVPKNPYIVPDRFLKDPEGKIGMSENHMCFSEENLRDRYSMLEKYNSNEIYKVLLSISNTKFKMTSFPTRYCLDKKIKSFSFLANKIESMSNLFDLTVTDQKNSFNNSRVYDRSYSIVFSNNLGLFFLNNVILINTDLLDEELYKLPDISQMIYKMIILPEYKVKVVKISMKKLVKKLNLKVNSSSSHLSVVRKHLDILKNNNFIKNHYETIERFSRQVTIEKM